MRFTVGDYVRTDNSIREISKITVTTRKNLGAGINHIVKYDEVVDEFNSIESFEVEYEYNKKNKRGKISRWLTIHDTRGGFFTISHKRDIISEIYENIKVSHDVCKLIDVGDLVRTKMFELGEVTFINGYSRYLEQVDMNKVWFKRITEIWTRHNNCYSLQWKKEVE